jgi:hypothetical protein
VSESVCVYVCRHTHCGRAKTSGIAVSARISYSNSVLRRAIVSRRDVCVCSTHAHTRHARKGGAGLRTDLPSSASSFRSCGAVNSGSAGIPAKEFEA